MTAVLLTKLHRQALHLAPIRPHSRTGFSGCGSSGWRSHDAFPPSLAPPGFARRDCGRAGCPEPDGRACMASRGIFRNHPHSRLRRRFRRREDAQKLRAASAARHRTARPENNKW